MSAGAPIVVVPLESQVKVPPSSKAVAFTGFEPPPVLGPEHPLRVTVLEAFPEMVVQVIPPAAPAVPANPSVNPATGISSAATVNKTRRNGFPFSFGSGNVPNRPSPSNKRSGRPGVTGRLGPASGSDSYCHLRVDVGKGRLVGPAKR